MIDCPKPADFESRRKQARARQAVATMDEARSLIRSAAYHWQSAGISTDLDVVLALSLSAEHLSDAITAAKAKVEA